MTKIVLSCYNSTTPKLKLPQIPSGYSSGTIFPVINPTTNPKKDVVKILKPIKNRSYKERF